MFQKAIAYKILLSHLCPMKHFVCLHLESETPICTCGLFQVTGIRYGPFRLSTCKEAIKKNWIQAKIWNWQQDWQYFIRSKLSRQKDILQSCSFGVLCEWEFTALVIRLHLVHISHDWLSSDHHQWHNQPRDIWAYSQEPVSEMEKTRKILKEHASKFAFL